MVDKTKRSRGDQPLEKHNPFSILSLSGGGFLGLYTASLLSHIEKEIGVPIARCFDLIAGTSVGGIIALAVAKEVPCEQIVEAFQMGGPKIFTNRPPPKGKISTGYDIVVNSLGARFTQTNLREFLAEVVGSETQLSSISHPLIITTVNLTKGKPQLFKTPHHPSFRRDKHIKLVDIALATSAAPTYFPLAEIDNSQFADGGLYANAPDLIAAIEAEKFLNAEQENLQILSIGTTTSKFSYAHLKKANLGWMGWMQGQRLIKVLMATQQQSTIYLMKHKYGKRYLRLDAETSGEQDRQLALHVASPVATKTLLGLASATFQSHINDETLKSIMSSRAVQRPFY